MNFRIKKLDIFIARQFLLLFAGTFFICLFVLMMQFCGVMSMTSSARVSLWMSLPSSSSTWR